MAWLVIVRRILLGQFTHRLGIGHIQWFALGGRVAVVACGQCGDEITLSFARLPASSLAFWIAA